MYLYGSLIEKGARGRIKIFHYAMWMKKWLFFSFELFLPRLYGKFKYKKRAFCLESIFLNYNFCRKKVRCKRRFIDHRYPITHWFYKKHARFFMLKFFQEQKNLSNRTNDVFTLASGAINIITLSRLKKKTTISQTHTRILTLLLTFLCNKFLIPRVIKLLCPLKLCREPFFPLFYLSTPAIERLHGVVKFAV